MSGDTLSGLLIVAYLILATVYMTEGNWLKVLYWISAAGTRRQSGGMK